MYVAWRSAKETISGKERASIAVSDEANSSIYSRVSGRIKACTSVISDWQEGGNGR